MRYLLSRASRSILAELAEERTLCAFDFDGTLAPVVENPDQVVLSDRTRHWLGRLAALYPCAFFPAAPRADLLGRVFGSHGAKGEGRKPKTQPDIQRWKAAIELQLGPVPGLWVEDKGLSLAVHYR